MLRPKSVVFTDNGMTASISVDGVELQNVISISIDKDETGSASVEVVQRFFPENMYLQKEGIDDGQA